MSKDTMIPEWRFPEFENDGEWEEKKLGEAADISKLAGYEFTKHIKYESEGKIIALRGLNIKNNTLDLTDVKYIDNSELSMLGRSKLYVDDLMFTYIGTIGEVALIEENDKFYLAPNVSRIRANRKVVNPRFLLQFFNIPYFKNVEISKFISSSSQPALTMGNVRRFTLFIPSLQEQNKIASCLSSFDELIAAHEDKLQALKDHKKGLMQNLFPQEGERVPRYRFKEFEKDGDWVHTTLEANCLVKGRIGYRGYTKQDLVKEGQGALVLGGKHIQNQAIDLSDPTFLSWEKYYESPEIMIEIDDIIFSQRGSLGDCAIIDREIGNATINPSMVLLKDLTCNAKFLYYILTGDSIQREVAKNSTSSAIPMLSQKQIKEFPFHIPKPEEQEKIASCLTAVDDLIIAQADKIEGLKLHKKGLMQGLFPIKS